MSASDGEGPAWNKFWMSLDNETESVMSGEGASSRMPHTPDARSLLSPDKERAGMNLDNVQPNDSASHHGDESPDQSAVEPPSATLENTPFPFKFKAPSGRMHRIHVTASAGMAELITSVVGKLGTEVETVGGQPNLEDGKLGKSGFALSYLDNEGDTVSITTDHDLLEAISLARQSHRDKVDLFVHHPDKPPLSATLDPHPGLAKPPTPPESVLKERRRYSSDETEEEEAEVKPKKERPISTMQVKQQGQLVAGLSNEVLLPGAIVTLAVVIVAVFAFSRSSSR